MPKITLGITELHEVLGRDCRSEKRYWGPSENESLLPLGRHYRSPVASRFGKCFPILLPYKNTELVHTAVIQLNFSRFAVVYKHPSGLSEPYLIEISLNSKPSSLLITLPK